MWWEQATYVLTNHNFGTIIQLTDRNDTIVKEIYGSDWVEFKCNILELPQSLIR